MKIKNAIFLLISISILTSIGLGISIIYSDYIYNPTGFIASVNIIDSSYLSSEPGVENDIENESENIKVMLNKIDEWAKGANATIIQKNGFVAGVGFCSYSDWIKNNMNIDVNSIDKSGVYLLNDLNIYNAYVIGDVFLPETVALEILGTYDGNNTPAIINGVDFIYPLSLSTSVEGMYFTDTTEIGTLIDLFEKSGYEILSIRQSQNMTIISLLQTLFQDNFLSKALLIALIGLCFCFIYCVLLMYRENGSLLWIHHIFGLSFKRFIIAIFIILFIISLISTILFKSLLVNGLTYLNSSDINRITKSVAVTILLLISIANLIGIYYLMKQFKLRD